MKPLDMPKKADKAEAAPAEVKKEEVIDFSKVEIERAGDKIKVIVTTARPGVVIGKMGDEIDALR